MAKKNIGATISLKDNGFKSGIKSAVSGLTSFKKGSEGATSSVKKFSSQTNSAGTSLASMAKKVVGVVAAYASMKQLITWGKACIDAANTHDECGRHDHGECVCDEKIRSRTPRRNNSRR